MSKKFNPNPLDIVPQPQSTTLSKAVPPFTLRPTTPIHYFPPSVSDLRSVAENLASLLNLSHNVIDTLAATNVDSSDYSDAITLILDDKLTTPEEAYKLSISSDRVRISAAKLRGLHHGIQTLAQIAHGADAGQWPAVKITDEPQFSWRGAMLDVGRHFLPVDELKRFIKVLAYHKINTFHWHLVEDQGWRIQIDKYPLLTSVGSWRIEPASRYGLPAGRYGGFYTKDEVRSVVALASSLGITVIPEIELPGHSIAALASYPHLGCTRGPYQVTPAWGVFDDVYCAGRESTFEFLFDVIAEVVELFPGPYFHLGGDECPKKRWIKCEDCRKRKKDEGVGNWEELQSYFVKRVARFIQEKGKTVIGWDEILEGGLPNDAVVQSWRGTRGGIQAIRAGHHAIMSPTAYCYFDFPYNMTSLEDSYGYDPIPDGLQKGESKLIFGGEGCMWTERTSPATLYQTVYPRLLALSSKLWTGSGNHLSPFDTFQCGLVKTHIPKRLEAFWSLEGIDNGDLPPVPKVVTVPGQVESNMSGWNTWPEHAVDGDPSTGFRVWQEPEKGNFFGVTHLKLGDARSVAVEVTTGLGGNNELKTGSLVFRRVGSGEWEELDEFVDGKAKGVIDVTKGLHSVRMMCTEMQWEQLCVAEFKMVLL